ncbi:hypothetical protein [Phyllobacterium leguminum]|uniref:Uncharacterized protein n=1 Tax=Phyllobacterium leguminum TaxID=314237 RepID=A0A318SZM0_9HYPH|nr:hypothetical protein [Phyllobacterium leguminum]PYE86904.1 hypothetical protein C7477_11842 [Phyllobacterium leguminum]
MPTISGFSTPVGCAMIAGGPVGEHIVPGSIRDGDTLLSVEHITDGTPPTRADITAEFSITPGKGGSITNTTTDTTGGFLHVLWSTSE